MKRKTLFFLLGLLFLVPISLHAYDFKSGDLYYNITSNTEPYTVEVTYEEYFSSNNYANLTTVTIPETVSYNNTTYTVTRIGDFAFPYCRGLTYLTIPNSVTSIGDCAFQNCTGLTSFTIPNSVTSLGDYVFCDGRLTSITIGNSVTSIGNDVFYHCGGLASIVVESGNTHYDSRNNCNAIIETATNTLIAGCQNTIIPNSVTSLGDYAFSGCLELTSITIPNSITSIGKASFWSCDGLTSIIIPNSVTSIGDHAFCCSSGLTSIVVESGNTHYDSRNNCNALIETATNTLMAGSNNTIIPNSVTSIGYRALYGRKGLTSITIPNSVTNIGEAAFAGCERLTYVTIGNGVTSIGRGAFMGCWSLTSITIPESVTSIGEQAFSYCRRLTSVTCNATVPPVCKSSFDNSAYSLPLYVPCGSLEAYKVADPWSNFINIQEHLAIYTLTVLSSNTTWGTARIDNPVACDGDGIAHISATAEKGCHFVRWSDGNTDNLRAITLTQDTILTAEFVGYSGRCGDNLYWTYNKGELRITGSGAMYNYAATTPWLLLRDSIYSITISNSASSIGANAFEGCTALSSVTIPDSVSSIGVGAFSECTRLTSIIWNAKNCSGNLGLSPSQITSFVFGNSVEVIPDYLCSEMSSLSSVTIPNSVTSIGEGAFNGCSKLSELHLGAGLETIGANAFALCRRLYNIYCYAALPPLAEETSFANYNSRVCVPCDVLSNYKYDAVWGNFRNIDCIGSEEVNVPTNSVTVIPTTNDATFTWPSNGNANAYTLVITKDGVVFCTLTFNANGQLTGIAFAPSKDRNNARAPQAALATANGWQFTVTGLNEGSNYAYTMTITDSRDKVLRTYEGTFTTLSSDLPEDLTQTSEAATGIQKIIRNGQVLIQRDGQIYNLFGKQIQ